MKKQDIYGVVSHAIELIGEHLQPEGNKKRISGNPTRDGRTVQAKAVAKLNQNYKLAEEAQIEFIRTQSKAVAGANELVHLFTDSLYSFLILGIRTDILKDKIEGEKKSLTEKAKDAICDGRRSDDFDDFDFAFDSDDSGYSGREIEKIVDAAYEHKDFRSLATDAPPLMFMYLLNHINKNNGKPTDFNPDYLPDDAVYRRLTESGWEDRPLVGCYVREQESSSYIHFEPNFNTNFTSIFTNKLDTMLNSTKQDNPDFFAVENLRRILFDLAVGVYLYHSGSVETYQSLHALTHLLNLHDAGTIITCDNFKVQNYGAEIEHAALIDYYDINNGSTHQINKAGLLSFVELIDNFGLSEMCGFNIIADRIRSL
jgi:hypothetical protein